LLQKGISNTSSKIDPGYNGNLLITVFNLGKKTIPLQRGERFCTLYLLQVLDGARPYNKPQKRIDGEAKKQTWQRIRDLLKINSAFIMVVLIIATLILAIVQFFD
jgi:deoxycytidine triphosphate deaminase